eukprot:1534216-Rhodomonas_salina.1
MDLDWRPRHVWLSRSGVTVGCCGLDGDSRRDGFGLETASRVARAVRMDNGMLWPRWGLQTRWIWTGDHVTCGSRGRE